MGWNPLKIIEKGVNWVKDRVEDGVDLAKDVGKGVVGLFTGGSGGGSDPEAARQAEEERKFNEEMEAQAAEMRAETERLEAENVEINGLLDNMRSESFAMVNVTVDGPPPDIPAFSQDFVGKELLDQYSDFQSFGISSPFATPSASGAPPDIAQALQQYGLDLNKLQMT